MTLPQRRPSSHWLLPRFPRSGVPFMALLISAGASLFSRAAQAQDAATDLTTKVASGISNAATSATEAGAGVVEAVTGSATNLANSATNLASNATDAMSSITNAAGNAVDALASGAETLTSGAEPSIAAVAQSMTAFQAIILGLVEGLTEYLPVSSTGHLLVTQELMGIPSTDASKAYAIVIQLGAILAVVGLYWPYILRMLKGLIGRDPEGLHLFVNLIIAFIPAAVVGLTFADTIKDVLFAKHFTLIGWFVGGIVILAWEFLGGGGRDGKEEVYRIGWLTAFGIGCFQVLAMWPGTSRSLVTILGACLLGLRLQTAVAFSFLLGAVTLSASTLYDGVKYGNVILDAYGGLNLFLGFLFALISAAFAVKWMVGYLNRHGLAIFGVYRIILAVVLALYWYVFT